MMSVQVVLVWILAVGASRGDAQSVTTVSLNKATTLVDRELYSSFININASSTMRFDFTDVNKNLSFIILQVHSFNYNVTVYYNTYTKGSFVTGRNIGLYSAVKPKLDVMYIENHLKDLRPISILPFISKIMERLVCQHLSDYVNSNNILPPKQSGFRAGRCIATAMFTPYPIPGGCNMEFPIPVSPFMRTTYLTDYIFVDAPLARSFTDFDCLQLEKVVVHFYLMYLPEGRVDAEAYFDGIRNMMSLEKIRLNGNKIPISAWPMLRMISAYTGIGTVYAAVAYDVENPEYYSVYVPTYNYACTVAEDGDCEILDDILSKFLCASLLFVGVFVCYFGHRFFKTEMFLFGMLTGVVNKDIDRAALLSASVPYGGFLGSIWVIFWLLYGIPFVAVTLPALNLGFLLSSILYIEILGDILLVQEDFNFWTLFIIVMVLTSMILVSKAFASNILCCAVLGAYAAVYPIDFYLGTHLKYFIINTVRSATVPDFNKAVLMMPFEWKDILLIVAWASLAVSGLVFQHYDNRNRPPFPRPWRSECPSRPESDQGYSAIPCKSRAEVPVMQCKRLQFQKVT